MRQKKKKSPLYEFDRHYTIEELAWIQGKGPIIDPKILHGDFWPEDEPIEKFLAALDEWRGRTKPRQAE